MKDAQLFEKVEAPRPGNHLAADNACQAPVLASEPPECLHHRDIGNNVDHITVDARRFASISLVKGGPRRRPEKYYEYNDGYDRRDGQSHLQADRREI